MAGRLHCKLQHTEFTLKLILIDLVVNMTTNTLFSLSHRPRCLMNCIVPADQDQAATSENQQQEDEADGVFTSRCSITKKARLALTSRHQVQPYDFCQILRVCEQWEAEPKHKGECNCLICISKTKKASFDPQILHQIMSKLDCILCSASGTNKEARWLRQDELMNPLEAAIKQHPLYQPSHHDIDHCSKLRDCTALLERGHEDPDSSEAHMQTSFAWLLAARRCIMLSTMSSSIAICRKEHIKAEYAANTQKVLQVPDSVSDMLEKFRQLFQLSFQYRLVLSNSGDFQPIYLGTPKPLPDGGWERITAVSPDVTFDLLYMQLMLRCDTFFVQCTGPNHIAGELDGAVKCMCDMYTNRGIPTPQNNVQRTCFKSYIQGCPCCLSMETQVPEDSQHIVREHRTSHFACFSV